MKSTFRSGRRPSTLSSSLQKRLNAYAIVAGTAGVSLLALAQSSEAEVIYTPTNQTIDRSASYSLDLNHDGIVDFRSTRSQIESASVFDGTNLDGENGAPESGSIALPLFALAVL